MSNLRRSAEHWRYVIDAKYVRFIARVKSAPGKLGEHSALAREGQGKSMKRLSLEELLENASSFHQAALRCWSSDAAASIGPDTLVRPYLVNQGVSVELYFKAIILQQTGKFTKGRNLLQLFGALAPSSQSEIREGVKAGRQAHTTSFDDAEFDACLESVSEAFANWSYLYEQSSASLYLTFLMTLGDVVRDHASSRS